MQLPVIPALEKKLQLHADSVCAECHNFIDDYIGCCWATYSSAKPINVAVHILFLFFL